MHDDESVVGEKAIQIFDGETMRPPAPAPDYRLFLLRDGRLLYYMDGGYSFDSSSTWRSFMIIMSSMNAALEASIKQRQKLLDDQLTLHQQLTQLVSRIA